MPAPEKFPAQVLTLVKINDGPDDDGNLVVCYQLQRGDGFTVLSLQSTDIDVGIAFNEDSHHITKVVPTYPH